MFLLSCTTAAITTWHSPFGWNTLLMNRILGGLLGYSSVNSIIKLNVPPSQGVSSGPKITACHTRMFESVGVALMP